MVLGKVDIKQLTISSKGQLILWFFLSLVQISSSLASLKSLEGLAAPELKRYAVYTFRRIIKFIV